MTDKRVKGQSQLDYLWTNYGSKQVSNTISKIPSDETILTESAIVSLLDTVNVTMDSKEINGVLHLYIRNQKGEILGDVALDKFSNIVKFEKFTATEEDVIQGTSQKLGGLGLLLEDDSGHSWKIDLSCLDYIGSETDSIKTVIKDRKIASVVKIDNPIVDRSVDIKTTSNGIRADIVIDETFDSAISIEKGENGLSCHYRWLDESYEIRLKALNFSEYNIIVNPDPGILYFILDQPCIFFRGKRYASPKPIDGYITESNLKETVDELKNYTDNKFIWYAAE